MTSKFVASEIRVDGKPVKKSYQNALIKAQSTDFWVDVSAGVRVHPLTNQHAMLSELEASILDWVLAWEWRYRNGVMATPISVFDNMRYLFIELNPPVNYDFIN